MTISFPKRASRPAFTASVIGTAGWEVMIGRGSQRREPRTKERMRTWAAAARTFDRKAGGVGRPAADQESPATLQGRMAAVPIAAPVAGAAVLPEDGAARRGRLNPILAQAGARGRAVEGRLRTHLGEHNGDPLHWTAIHLPGKTIAVRGLPGAVSHGLVLVEDRTGASAHGIVPPIAAQSAVLGHLP